MRHREDRQPVSAPVDEWPHGQCPRWRCRQGVIGEDYAQLAANVAAHLREDHASRASIARRVAICVLCALGVVGGLTAVALRLLTVS